MPVVPVKRYNALDRAVSRIDTLGNNTASVQQQWWLRNNFTCYAVAYFGTAVELCTNLFQYRI